MPVRHGTVRSSRRNHQFLYCYDQYLRSPSLAPSICYRMPVNTLIQFQTSNQPSGTIALYLSREIDPFSSPTLITRPSIELRVDDVGIMAPHSNSERVYKLLDGQDMVPVARWMANVRSHHCRVTFSSISPHLAHILHPPPLQTCQIWIHHHL